MNALGHGLGCRAVVISGERKKHWEAHLAGIFESLAPFGTLEEELAEQVATITWRMRRVIRYETGVMSGRISSNGRSNKEFETIDQRHFSRTRQVILGEIVEIREKIADFDKIQTDFNELHAAPDDRRYDGEKAYDLIITAVYYSAPGNSIAFEVTDHSFLAKVGVDLRWLKDPGKWDEWTAGILKNGLKIIGQRNGQKPLEVFEHILYKSEKFKARYVDDLARLEAELSTRPASVAVEETEALDEEESHDPIMDLDMLNNVIRYGGHLRRELNDALETLNSMQANRRLGLMAMVDDVATESAG
jgi:hypothetical protein